MVKFNSFLSWSGGKDSAFSLFSVHKEKRFHISSLLTTFSSATRRVTMHGIKEELIEEQSRQTGIPLVKMYLPENADNKIYSENFESVLEDYRKGNVFWSVFGDIYLDDLRNFREGLLKRKQMNAYFPLWKRNTIELSREFIDSGFKAVVVCVNSLLLDKSFCGRLYDKNFLKDLPENIDPCGENGEFHTFVFDGPVLKNPVNFEKGEVQYMQYNDANKSGFWFLDLMKKGVGV